jgi:hypothetical protein
MENYGDKTLKWNDGYAGTLSLLPSARIGTKISTDPSLALPWLLDEVTLMTDSQVLDLSKCLTARHLEKM